MPFNKETKPNQTKISSVSWGCRKHQMHLHRGVKPLKMSILGMWWWGSGTENLRNEEYFFISITPWSTLTQVSSAC